MAIDFEAEGLLDGLDGPARKARLELLESLHGDGYELDSLREAADDGRLALLAVERILGGGSPTRTQQDIAERTGLDIEFLQRLWRALGMALADPDERAFTDADLEAAERVKAFREAGMDDDRILEISRVMGRSMYGVAASIGEVFRETYQQPGDDEMSLAQRYAEAARAMTPMLGPMLEHVLLLQQRSLIDQVAVETTVLAGGKMADSEEVAVCFADLVDFTKLGESVAPAELGAVADRLEELAGEVAEPPVRLIKTIGDAVMLQSRDTDELLAAALAIVEAADSEGEGFPQLCAGVARGEALPRAGDWYGRPVNLASRITDIARPGSVLVDGEVKDAAQRGFRFSFAGGRRIKGVDGEVKLYRARAPEEGPKS
ncbi:MAG TPA: adenylate cyclase regulatory domain-containing protein [Thermoleophilaceae bacterium]|nr:adenylate cyclase regulatory domain-containing protein [Thermoleophilaceae bacterium]